MAANPTTTPRDVSVGYSKEGHSSGVDAVGVTGDGKRAVPASSDRTLKVRDLATGRELRTLKGHAGYVADVGVTADGKRVVSASGDHTLKVWDLTSGHAPQMPEGHSDRVLSIALTPDGKWAVSASGTTHSKYGI